MPGEIAKNKNKNRRTSNAQFREFCAHEKEHEKQQQSETSFCATAHTSSYCSLSDDKAREKIKSLVRVSFISRRVMDMSGAVNTHNRGDREV